MKEKDFILDHVDDKTLDYWFNIIGDTKRELTEKYMEQSMVEVCEGVFSVGDGQWGIKRLFPFNYDVITPSEDKELYQTLKRLATSAYKQSSLASD